MSERNLSKEYAEVMKEFMGMIKEYGMKGFDVFDVDAPELIMIVKSLGLFNKLIDISAAMLEKQEKLMDKLDKVCDKQLEG